MGISTNWFSKCGRAVPCRHTRHQWSGQAKLAHWCMRVMSMPYFMRQADRHTGHQRSGQAKLKLTGMRVMSMPYFMRQTDWIN